MLEKSGNRETCVFKTDHEDSPKHRDPFSDSEKDLFSYCVSKSDLSRRAVKNQRSNHIYLFFVIWSLYDCTILTFEKHSLVALSKNR